MKLWVRSAAAMIIGMAAILPASAQIDFAKMAKWPEPVAFSNQIELGNIEQARAWLADGLPVDFSGSRIGTGLMIGAWEGRIDMMRLFLEAGADINQINGSGESALALAAYRGHMEAVKWLLDKGARVNAPPRNWSALHYAAFNGHKDLVDYLLSRGANINAFSPNGSSALMLAIYEGREDIVKKLLEKGAARGVRNDWGDGALEWAMRHNHTNIVRLLGSPAEFEIVMEQPREAWGTPQRSMRPSKELENLLKLRENLVDRGLSTDGADRRIAAERARIVRSEMERQPAPAARAATLEVTANRKAPAQQSTQIIYDDKGKQVGYKAPSATYTGTPKMPVGQPSVTPPVKKTPATPPAGTSAPAAN